MRMCQIEVEIREKRQMSGSAGIDLAQFTTRDLSERGIGKRVMLIPQNRCVATKGTNRDERTKTMRT